MFNGNLGEPASHAAAVTPADGSDISPEASALFIGGAGDVSVHVMDGSTVTFVGVAAGSILPVRVKRVLSTSTTATNIVALV